MESESVVWRALLEIVKKAKATEALRMDPSVVAFERFMKTGPGKPKPAPVGGTTPTSE